MAMHKTNHIGASNPMVFFLPNQCASSSFLLKLLNTPSNGFGPYIRLIKSNFSFGCAPTTVFRPTLTSIIWASLCSVCNGAMETVGHIFFECPLTKKFWLDFGLNMHYITNNSTYWLQNVHDLDVPIHNSSLGWKLFYPFALWHIWLLRNQNIFHPKPQGTHHLSLQQIIMRATEFLYLADSPKVHARDEVKTCWLPPSANGYKLNTDGAFCPKNSSSDIGGVIRDSQGNWIIGYCKNSNAFNHVLAELQALELDLQIALDNHKTPLEVETDSTDVIELLYHPFPTYSSIVESCRSLLKKLGNPVVQHNFREGNTLTDFLAKQGCILSSTTTMPSIWLEAPLKVMQLTRFYGRLLIQEFPRGR